MSVTRRSRLALALVCLMNPLSGCAAQPTKELARAEGAIEAARSASAATYATADLQAAEATLARAHADLTERDFRAALGHACDARSRAQVAATAAVEQRVKARLAADQTLDDFASLIEKRDAALATPEAKRAPALARRSAAAAVATALAILRDARDAVERDGLSVLRPIPAPAETLDAATASLAPPPPRTARSRS